MLSRPQTYYFGRLNLISSYTRKKEFLYKGLSTNALLYIRNFIWGFFDIEEFTDSTGEYITGFLTKYKPITEEEKADEELHRIITEDADKRVNAKSRFFLHIDSGLIVYHHVGRRIMRGQFENNFCRLFERGHEQFFVSAEIQSIDEKYEVLEVIKSLKNISKVSFYLHPSNPSPGIWKDVDDRLKKLKASQYREEYTSKPGENLEIIEDEDFNNKLNMAVDGYGETNISASLDDKQVVISTRNNPVIASSIHEDTDTRNVFSDLKDKIQDIFSRFIRNEN